MRTYTIILFSAVIVLFASMHSAHAVTISSALRSDILSDVHTMTEIDDALYIIDHAERGLYTEKRVYRQQGKKLSKMQLVFAAKGAPQATDRITQHGDAVFMTVTGKRGNRVRVYRSTDDGQNFSMMKKIGFFKKRVQNDVVDMFSEGDRLYVVIEENRRKTSHSGTKKLALWSTTTGKTWNKQIMTNTDLAYAGYTEFDGDPYLYVNQDERVSKSRLRSQSGLLTPQSFTSKSFRQVSLQNFHGKLPIRSVQQVLNYEGNTFLRGYISTKDTGKKLSRTSNMRSLRSVNGVKWKAAGGKFTNFVVHSGTLFAQQNNDVWYSTDGKSFTQIAFSFASDYDLIDKSLQLYGSADEELLFARFMVPAGQSAVEQQCLVTQDAVTWSAIDCRVPEKAAPRQVVKAGKFWYFVRGREQSSFRLFRLSF